MSELVLQGDIEAAIVKLLSAASEISGFTPAITKVSTDLVGYEPGDYWIQVQRQGGNILGLAKKIDKPRVDVYIHGLTRSNTLHLAQVVQGVLFRDGPTYSGQGVRITDVRVETGILRADDKLESTVKYVCAFRLTAIPAP